MEQTHIFMGLVICSGIGALVSVIFWRTEQGVGSIQSMTEL